MFWNRERHSTIKGLAAGAIGGAVGSFAMNQFQAGMSKLFEHPQQDPEKQQRAQAGAGLEGASRARAEERRGHRERDR